MSLERFGPDGGLLPVAGGQQEPGGAEQRQEVVRASAEVAADLGLAEQDVEGLSGAHTVFEDDALSKDACPAELRELEFARPKTRGDCVDGPRPCPFASCRHHLLFDMVRDGRGATRLKLAHGHDDPTLLEESCSLDVADSGGMVLAEVGEILGIVRERARQIEAKATAKIREAGGLADYRGHEGPASPPHHDEMVGESEGLGVDQTRGTRMHTRAPFLPESHLELVRALADRADGAGPDDDRAGRLGKAAREDAPEDDEGWCERVWSAYERATRREGETTGEVEEKMRHEDGEKCDRETEEAYRNFMTSVGRPPQAKELAECMGITVSAARQRLTKIRKRGLVPPGRRGVLSAEEARKLVSGLPYKYVEETDSPEGVERRDVTGPNADDNYEREVRESIEANAREAACKVISMRGDLSGEGSGEDNHALQMLRREREALGLKLLQIDDAIARLRGV